MQKMKRNGQITIPKDMRERLNLQDGDYIETELKEEGILIRFIDVVHTARKFQSA